MAEAQAEQGSVDFGQALASLLRRYLETARDAVADLPGGPRGFQVMSVANGGACSNQATIAEDLGIDRTVMTYLVDDLEQAGLAERRPDPADRRARQVILTATGRKAFDAAAARIAEVERAVLGSLSDADADLFRQLLARITASGPVVHDANACSAAAEADAC